MLFVFLVVWFVVRLPRAWFWEAPIRSTRFPLSLLCLLPPPFPFRLRRLLAPGARRRQAFSTNLAAFKSAFVENVECNSCTMYLPDRKKNGFPDNSPGPPRPSVGGEYAYIVENMILPLHPRAMAGFYSKPGFRKIFA